MTQILLWALKRGRAGRAALIACAVLAAPPILSVAPAWADTIAVLQGLDKTTARASIVEAPIDRAVQFGTLLITVRACYKAPPEEPPNTVAFLQIDEVRARGATASSDRVFSGWMFASSPALSALEHPVYDVTVLDCKNESGSPAKSTGK